MKRNLLFFTALLSFFISSVKAEIYKRSLSDSLVNISSDSLRVLSKTYRYSNPKKAKVYAETLFKRGQNNNHLKDLASGYHQLGLVDDVLGNYNAAIKKFNSSIELSKATNDSLLLIDLYLVKGNAYLYKKEYEYVFALYDSALHLARKVNNLQYVIISNSNIAYLKKEVGLLEEALAIEKENLKLSKNVSFTNNTIAINLIFHLSETYLALNKNDSAIYYSKKALARSLSINNIEGTSYIYQTLGLAYYNKKDYERSISSFTEAIAIIKPFNNEQLLSELFFHKGRALYKLEKANEAITSLRISEEFIIKNDSINPSISLAHTYKLMAEIYKSNNNYKLSGDYFEKYIVLNQEKNQSKLNTVQDLYQNNIENKNEIIARLSSEQKKEIQIIPFILFPIIILIAVSIIFYSIKKSKKNKNHISKNSIPIKDNKKTITKRINNEKAEIILEGLDNLERTKFFLNENVL